MKEALTLALKALEAIYTVGDVACVVKPEGEIYLKPVIDKCKAALAQPEQDDRRLQIAMRQWEDWKTYALELQKKLVKYEGGSPMILNTQPEERNFCSRCGKRLASGFVEISIHTCTPPRGKT